MHLIFAFRRKCDIQMPRVAFVFSPKRLSVPDNINSCDHNLIIKKKRSYNITEIESETADRY